MGEDFVEEGWYVWRGRLNVAGNGQAGYWGVDINGKIGHFGPFGGSLQIGIDVFETAEIRF
ncbi:hypothetical protein [Saccharothrix violaceirubra]|uniref:Uncharacterized protein n=1 Tax=Saccharothrix violaceirubra TaxID=413306 RepID=A0A7W7SYV7_9PSEU|nr:hypothetical protein [Saccharothrix violaceirubra]MBB4963487.1 hypothetical protein [Saccharothrix violaceirubra]